MKRIFYVILAIGFFLSLMPTATAQEKTAFQIAAPFNEVYDVRSDVAIVYGINDAGGHFEERVKGWRDQGYQVHFMTGIAWGQYQDYFLGSYDGKSHLDEGQVQVNGDTIWHGRNVPYIVPSASYLGYMKTHLKRAIDAGVTAIHLEEPEFWARAGYSTAFKKEWKAFYGFDWQPQDASPQATWWSSKLKYQLYYNALKECFHYIKSYSRSVGKKVQCFVPTHSLVNYASWAIVSPEASLASIEEMDGYIAQVWTGTSREPVYYDGISKERVFENAFLEYGSMISMVAPTGKKIYLLTDPIEDRSRSWDDYKKNYQATYTAELLYPQVADYEVMPWPNRIYQGHFPVAGSDKREPIAPTYATQMQVMVNALNQMPVSANKVTGSHGIGILMSNTLMFQRFPTHQGYEDPQLSNFYGLALPLLKKGIPVEIVHIENLLNDQALKNIRVLIMSYSNMKPLKETYHQRLADWVKKGGVLIYYGRDDDPFQRVTEWWNTNGKSFKAPAEDLFRKLGIRGVEDGSFVPVGKGWVCVNRKDPKELVMQPAADQSFVRLIKAAYERKAHQGKLVFKNNFQLRRGAYIISAVMDESTDLQPLQIEGLMIDLFDPELPVLTQKTVSPGQQAFLYDLRHFDLNGPEVLASASRQYKEQTGDHYFRFVSRSPSGTVNAMRISLPASPRQISVKRQGQTEKILKQEWDPKSKTLLLKFNNHSQGVEVDILW